MTSDQDAYNDVMSDPTFLIAFIMDQKDRSTLFADGDSDAAISSAIEQFRSNPTGYATDAQGQKIRVGGTDENPTYKTTKDQVLEAFRNKWGTKDGTDDCFWVSRGGNGRLKWDTEPKGIDTNLDPNKYNSIPNLPAPDWTKYANLTKSRNHDATFDKESEDFKLLWDAAHLVDDPLSGHALAWSGVRSKIGVAKDNFGDWLHGLWNPQHKDSQWAGVAAQAFHSNLSSSLDVLEGLRGAAELMEWNSDIFNTAISWVGESLRLNALAYGYMLDCVTSADASKKQKGEDLRDKLNKVAKAIMKTYHDAVGPLSDKHPDMDKLLTPHMGNPSDPGPNSNPSGTGGTGGPSGGTPDISTPDASNIDPDQLLASDPTSTSPSSTPDLSQAMQPATDAAQQGAKGLEDGAQKAADAGQQALQDALNSAQGLQDPGNSDSDGMADGSGSYGTAGSLGGLAGLRGGAGSGSGSTGGRSPVLGRQPNVRTADALARSTPTAAKSGASLSSNGATGAAGAPGTGARGTAQAAQYKGPPRYARNTVNGKYVTGVDDVAATVEVVGAAPSEAEKTTSV